MKLSRMFVIAFLMTMTCFTAFAEETSAPAMTAEQQAKMEEMKKLGAPSENHKSLEPMIGKWTAAVKMWMAPESQPEESTGSSDNHWIMGGRFVQQDFKGSMMGQPFEGMGLIGYDNIRAEYTNIWLDNMSTGVMVGSSQYDAATKSYAGNATASCPMTGEKNRPMRSVCKTIDSDHLSHEMYMNDKDGKEFKVMEIVYTRA